MKVEAVEEKKSTQDLRGRREETCQNLTHGRRRIERDRTTHQTVQDRKEIAFKLQLVKRSSYFGLDSPRRVQG